MGCQMGFQIPECPFGLPRSVPDPSLSLEVPTSFFGSWDVTGKFEAVDARCLTTDVPVPGSSGKWP